MTETVPERRSVIIERTLSALPEKLWRALTHPHLIEERRMNSDFKPVEGHKFTLVNEPKPEVTIKVDAEVLKVEEHNTLA